MNGDTEQDDGRNGYLDLVRGGVPRDIARFGIESDPSTNVLGTGTRIGPRSHLRLVTDDEFSDDLERSNQHPVLTIISLVLILVWVVVPAGLVILAHTGTWP
jgi:hypothetical protein